jgi:transglutaminase-like putative cysteine protease
MVELEEELLSSGISKKRVVGVLLLVGLIVAALTFSVTLFNWLTDSKRLEPNENLLNTIPYQPSLTTPPLPWDPNALADILDPEDFKDWLDYLNSTLTDEQKQDLLDDLLDQYSDMIDGNIDDLDLSLFAGLIGAFLLSDTEVFRIYDYDNIDSILGKLWKYESFDEFTGTKWQSTSTQSSYNFYRYSDYLSKYSGKDIFNISMPLSPNQTGYSSFVIPNLFPIPFIMEDSVHATSIDESETRLSKTEFNSTILTLDFTSTGDLNMTYELFGLDLPTFTEVNNSAVDEGYTPNSIKNRYLQLPPDISTYINAHPYFESHYNTLDGIIQDGDNAATVADKIQNYLESNFVFNASAIFTNPPAPGDDTVEWFCQYQEGVWSDFVSAFCAFARSFGLACRYIDGYNTRNLQEIYDPLEGKNVIPIMQSNIYNWAEIYVPTSTNGSGNWVQFDVCENISPYGNATTVDFNISISTNFTEGYRGVGNLANISAKLTSINQSVANRIITFRDLSMNKIIDAVSTDQNGNAWTTVNINTSQTIGVHYISATYSSAVDYTNYTITGPTTNINLYLTDVSPTTVNISNGETANVQGYLEDPLNGNRVNHAYISFLLFNKGSPLAIPNALIPFGTITDDNGEFDISLTLNNSLPSGEYEIQADFNGTWIFYTGINFSIDTYPFINDSSNRLDLNITKEQTYSIWFYMNDIEASNNTAPEVTRTSTIELKALLLDELGNPITSQTITFLDYSNNIIGQNQTNSTGYAVYYYDIDNSIPGGPNKVYASYGNTVNSSYFILNANISLYLNTFPQPHTISKRPSDRDTFIIEGYLYDENYNPIKYGYCPVTMEDGGVDVSYYLTLKAGNVYSDGLGYIYQVFNISDSTPSKNYTLQVNFNGIFFYPDPHFFDFSGYSDFSSSQKGNYPLEVYDPDNITILFEINGTPTRSYFDDSNPPNSYNKGDNIQFSVDIYQDLSPVMNGTVYFYDVDQNNALIGSYTFDGNEIPNGHYNFTVDTSNAGWHAGLHQIRVTWGSSGVYNSTYIIINETATISIDQSTFSVQRGVDNFIISGDIYDGSYNLRGLEVGIHLFDSNNQDVSKYLNFASGYSQNMTTDNNGEFTFLINSIDIDTLQGQYTLRIDFNGTIHEAGIDLSDFMIHFTSYPLNINLTAVTQIIQQDYYTLKWETEYPEYWVDTDTLIVIGNLTWDNNTGIAGMYINVTVEDLAGNIIDYNDTVQTDSFGGFNVSIDIDPSESWPNYRADSEIWVDFNPNYNGLDYVTPSSKKFT